MIRLAVLGGDATFSSPGPRVVVGRHETCDLRLDDPTVSQFHCELVRVEDRLDIRDLGSRNRTRLEGVAVVHAPLRPPATLALGQTQLRVTLGEGASPASPERSSFGDLVGRSPAMRRAFDLLEMAAASGATVLLRGETGTGKDEAAELLHARSERGAGPYIVLDCSALPPGIVESELFGHEKGAFTGATDRRIGAFEAAHGGTLFLDEIGELPLDMQAKLLRALEKREIRRLGSQQVIACDVRVVAATHRDLRLAVNQRRFRSDLYYRLAVVEIELPPLREHLEDLDLLVEALLSRSSLREHPDAASVRTPAFLAQLARHAWPGNVRELRNFLERTIVLGAAPEPPRERPPARDLCDPSLKLADARRGWLDAFERGYLEQLIAAHGENLSAAARVAGLDRALLYRLLRRQGLR